jgi:hypothetical protein
MVVQKLKEQSKGTTKKETSSNILDASKLSSFQ